MIQITIQYTQRVRNLRLHFVDWQMTFCAKYSLKMQIIEKLILLRLVKMLFIAISLVLM